MTGTPLVVAQTVARNIMPLAGIVFLGWNALPVLVLYFVDTILSIAVLFAGVLRKFAPPVEDDGWAARLNGEAGMIGGGLFVALVIAVPLGIPLVFMVTDGAAWRTLLDDPAFRVGVVGQAIAAFWSYVGLWRALRIGTVEQLRLKRRFNLVMLRWIALVIVAYTGLGMLLGRSSALLFVALYVVVSVWAEVAPDRLLRAVPGIGEPPQPAPLAQPTLREPRRRSGRRSRR
jgi:hypothetical protein